MGTKNSIVAKAVGSVVVGLLAVTLGAGPADAGTRSTGTDSGTSLSRDTGWGFK